MKRRTIIFFLLGGSLLFASCQKDSDVFVPDPSQLNGPDTNWYSVITPSMPVSTLKTNLADVSIYSDTINVNSNAAYVITPFGLVCGFPPNCCVNNAGQPISGIVNVELRLIKKKGDMILLNRPTTSNGRLLINDGEVYIRLKKDGQEVQLAPNVKIQLRFPFDQPIATQMKLFFGDESNPDAFNWLPNTDLTNNTLAFSPPNYEIQTNHLKWISADYFYDTTGISRTKVAATLDPQFTNANTSAYVVFNDFRTVVTMTGDLSNRKFMTGLLPVGKNITIIVISKQGNDYFMDHKQVTTALPATTPVVQSIAVKPVITTLTNIKAYLGTL